MIKFDDIILHSELSNYSKCLVNCQWLQDIWCVLWIRSLPLLPPHCIEYHIILNCVISCLYKYSKIICDSKCCDWINLRLAEFILGDIRIYLHFLSVLRLLKSYLVDDKDLLFLHSQYQGRWCRSIARNQGISSYGIDLMCQEYSGDPL